MAADLDTIERVSELEVDKYKYGFTTDIDSVKAPKGLSEDIVRFISAKKNEPEWMLQWRLDAYRRWLTMTEPVWANVHYPKIDYNDLYYYSAPKSAEGPKSLDDVDPELLRTYERLGIPLQRARDSGGRAGRQGGGGRGVRQRLGCDHLQGRAGQGRGDLLPDLRGAARLIPTW